MKAWIWFFALMGMLEGGTANADGNDLLKSCQAAVRMMDTDNLPPNDSFEVGQCFGIVEGVRGVLFIYEDKIPESLRVCLPKGGINNGQAARIVSKYLHDNPKDLNLDSTLLTILALKTAYSCK
ncbi:hypothetical protein CRX42_13760 [Pseudomonas jessenii]|uniref:Rap1a immunity protein domain-containing protein n=1 Tax=Pseudomonas jessenii TaxID=77298 RepID=A0A2W0EPU5_PSEJE|nr:Rap1a/Tai family immunity protein [Pseudomonas jessenii]PYY69967.1 hypothetical protein CRX42_13760 [Pseudomonas jessenii]